MFDGVCTSVNVHMRLFVSFCVRVLVCVVVFVIEYVFARIIV